MSIKDMMRKLFLSGLLCLLLGWLSVEAQPLTVKFAERDTCSLYMDIYQPKVLSDSNVCVVFVYGGGFIEGSRKEGYVIEYAQLLAEKGFTVACIDYRLGLKNADIKGVRIINSTEKAINMAVEDLYSATLFLIDNANKYHIDSSKIVLCGNSAGAITVLQADYELCNRMPLSQMLPETFHYAGVMAFAGAIFSREGKVNYKRSPAPTMFLHGTEDKLVKYNGMQFANMGFFGSNALVKRFEKFEYPYYFRRYENIGHDVATYMKKDLDIAVDFIQKYVKEKKCMFRDETMDDRTIKPSAWGAMKPKDLYKK